MKTNQLDLDQFEGFTPGPWHVLRSGAFHYVMTQSGYTLAKIDPAFSYRKAHPVNAELFAAAPALLAECRRLQAENERLRGALKQTSDSLFAAMETCRNGYKYETVWEQARAALNPTE